ncbi:MAG: hypothetical protein IH621_17965 [Krumholzibacteria bacterium]|nr:hypothetical protein [Candidatus Krumholzibacteria bacterium]
MKSTTAVFLLTLLLPLAAAQAGPVGSAFSYQGQLVLDGVPVSGLVDLQFYLYDAEVSGTLVDTGRQLQAVNVDQGVFTVQLDWGASVFDGNERWLEIRVRNPHDLSNSQPFTALAPRQRISAVPYALHALNGGGGGGGGFWEAAGTAIRNTNTGFVGIGRTSPVTTAEVFGLQAPGDGFAGMYIRSDGAAGLPFYGYRTPSFLSYHYLSEATGTWQLYNGGNLYFTRTGRLGVNTANPTSTITAAGIIESTSGGFRFPDGTIQTTAGGGGGGASESLTLIDGGANTTMELLASISGPGTAAGPRLELRNTTGQETFSLFGGNTSGGVLGMYNTADRRTIHLASNYTAGAGALFELEKANGSNAIRMQSHGGFGEATNGPEIGLYNLANSRSLVLHGDYQGTGESRVVTSVLEITGGSDLSERFDVAAGALAVEPGAVVSIDPDSPGDLRLSDEAYDRKVAGIVSGADGVRPGLLMGQRGTAADGAHPVALTGRVYCKVDATFGPIRPGDLLTTSPTPGHAMRVDDPGRAHGAILGKAMTSLESGQGLVLVLVSLH